MHTLPAKTREVLDLRYAEDLSGESIALRTGLSAANVYQLLSRTRLALAECIRKRLARPTHES